MNLDERVRTGLLNEIVFEKYMIDKGFKIINNNINLNNNYTIIDFTINTDKIQVSIEFKSRSIDKNKYPTTLLKCNKIDYFQYNINNKLLGLKTIFYIVYQFNNDTNYYCIKYNKKIFDTYNKINLIDKMTNEYKLHYLIPIDHLHNIDILNKYI
jgi:hypothetical protein